VSEIGDNEGNYDAGEKCSMLIVPTTQAQAIYDAQPLRNSPSPEPQPNRSEQEQPQEDREDG